MSFFSHVTLFVKMFSCYSVSIAGAMTKMRSQENFNSGYTSIDYSELSMICPWSTRINYTVSFRCTHLAFCFPETKSANGHVYGSEACWNGCTGQNLAEMTRWALRQIQIENKLDLSFNLYFLAHLAAHFINLFAKGEYVWLDWKYCSGTCLWIGNKILNLLSKAPAHK